MSPTSDEPLKTFFRPAITALTPYQPGKPIEDVQRELGLERVVKLASNEGPFPPFPAALEAMARGAAELNRYPDGGAFRLHEALAARHGVPFEQVCAGSGADGCLDMLSQAVLDPGDEIVCGWPSFPSYVIYALKLGAVPKTVPLRDHRYDLEALLGAVTPRTKLVYICHPNNPTGTVNSHAELDGFFDQVPEHVLTVVDQAYFEYIDDPDYPDAVEEYEARPPSARSAHVLEDLRPRRAPGRVRRRTIRCLCANGEDPAPVRPDNAGAGGRAREHRRAGRARVAARAER